MLGRFVSFSPYLRRDLADHYSSQATVRPMNPPINQTRRHGPSSSSAATKLEHSTAGVKRSADAMSSGSNSAMQYVTSSLALMLS